MRLEERAWVGINGGFGVLVGWEKSLEVFRVGERKNMRNEIKKEKEMVLKRRKKHLAFRTRKTTPLFLMLIKYRQNYESMGCLLCQLMMNNHCPKRMFHPML